MRLLDYQFAVIHSHPSLHVRVQKISATNPAAAGGPPGERVLHKKVDGVLRKRKNILPTSAAAAKKK